MSLIVPKAAPAISGLLPRDTVNPSCVSSCSSGAITTSDLCSLGIADTAFGACVKDACASEDITAFLATVTASCVSGASWASSGWSSATIAATASVTSAPGAFPNSTLTVLPSGPASSAAASSNATTASASLSSLSSLSSARVGASSAVSASTTPSSSRPTDASATTSAASSTATKKSAGTRAWPGVRCLVLGLVVGAVGTWIL